MDLDLESHAEDDSPSMNMNQDDIETFEANLAIERQFYGRDEQGSPAESVDLPEIFRSQS